MTTCAYNWHLKRGQSYGLEEAAFDPGIGGCSGIRVKVRAEDRRNNLGKVLEMKNAAE